MSEFGLHLKQARENRGISLRQIASATKIATGALEALERGDFSRLPGGIFSRAFVRAYADEVGLDPEETVRQYTELAEAAAASSLNEVTSAEITDDDRMFLERQRMANLWLKIIAITLLVALSAAFGWWRVSVARRRAPVVNVVTEPAPPPPPVVTTPSPAPTPVDAGTATGSEATTAAQPQATAAVTPPAPRTVAIQLRAEASCWVQVTADGKLLMSRNLTAGESQSFQADKKITVQFGNAGAITWTINGKPAAPLGAMGDVRKATITPDTAASFWK